MNALPPNELAAHVVAWHNRHPLARRVTQAQIQSMGFVVLPFVAGGAAAPRPPAVAQPPPAGAAAEGAQDATLRERAMAKARQQALDAPAAPAAAAEPPAAPQSEPDPDTLHPAFSEDLLPPLSVARLSRWVARHGAPMPLLADTAPVRALEPHPGIDASRLSRRWVQTALIETGQRRTRLLIGVGPNREVLGPRLWSLPRLAGLAALVLGALALAASGVTGAPAAVVPTPPAGPAPAASTPAQTPASGSAARTAPADEAAVATLAPVPLSAPATAPAAAELHIDRPLDVEPTLGQVNLPSLGPRIDHRRQALRQARAPTAPSPPASAEAAPVSVRTVPIFALTTRLLRTRSESHQVADALRALLVTAAAPKRQVHVLTEGEDFRVVAGPYERRTEAEQLRAQLAARGLKMRVIDF